jgi:peptide deformylase
MSHLDLVDFDNPILYTETRPFDFQTENAQEAFENLRDKLAEMKGYGLSANQVGLPYRLFVFGDGRTKNSIIPCFNAQIVSVSGETELLEEGCLSFPGLIAKVERARSIRVRYANVNGHVDTIKFDGLTARIFQHEMCHMLGKPFFAGFSRLKIEMMVKKCAKRTGIHYNTTQLLGLRN